MSLKDILSPSFTVNGSGNHTNKNIQGSHLNKPSLGNGLTRFPGTSFANVFKVNPMATQTQRPATGIFRGNRKKAFSVKRDTDADKQLDDYLQKRYDYLKDKVSTGKNSLVNQNNNNSSKDYFMEPHSHTIDQD